MDEGLRWLARDLDRQTRRELIDVPPSDPDPLRAVEALRRDYPDWPAERVAAIASQRELGQRGRTRSAIPPAPWLLTRTGLEQSTRTDVASLRARHLADAGVASVVDLTAGLGGDAWACTRAGLAVLAVERDPLTAELCRANVPEATVVCADGTTLAADALANFADLPFPICWLVDPARRGREQRTDGTRAAPERDPQKWEPPWSFVQGLRDRGEWVAAKAPGGFQPDAGWSAEWVGIADYVAECAVYSIPHPGTKPLGYHQQATLLGSTPNSPDLTLEVSDEPAPIGPLQDFLGEVHPVFARSLPAVCTAGVTAISSTSRYLTASRPDTPGVRWFRILAQGSLKELRRTAQRLDIDAVAIKSRESRTPQATLRKQVGLPDGNRYAVILVHGRPEAILGEAVSGPVITGPVR